MKFWKHFKIGIDETKAGQNEEKHIIEAKDQPGYLP